MSESVASRRALTVVMDRRDRWTRLPMFTHAHLGNVFSLPIVACWRCPWLNQG